MFLEDDLLQQIISLIDNSFNLTYREVTDESYMHHTGKDAGTHFKLLIVTQDFEGKSLVERHRQLQKIFSEYIAQNIRMSFCCYTPEEFNQAVIPETPACRGGYNK